MTKLKESKNIETIRNINSKMETLSSIIDIHRIYDKVRKQEDRFNKRIILIKK